MRRRVVARLSVDLAMRERFKVEVAPRLAQQLPGRLRAEHHVSKLFSYFGDSDRFVVVAGAQSGATGWALVYGLAVRKGRRLVLVLPHDAAFATMQRVPWLTQEARPEIWLHQDGALQDAPAPERSRLGTIEAVRAWARKKSDGAGPAAEPGPAAELRAASTPRYLGEQSAGVRQLVEWATSHPQLDAAHNQSTRSWLCAGQKVLSLDSGHGVVQVRAGIHDKQRMSAPDESLAPGETLTREQVRALQQKVASAIGARIEPGGPYYKPDEHWFQSVLRRDPSLVGVESPALREVPAWRPAGAEGSFGRGFIDLVGLDGHGDIRIVEAKIAKSSDDIWAPLFPELLDSPFWGKGIGSVMWSRAMTEGRLPPISHPHNAYLQAYMDMGLIGLMLLLAFWIYIWARCLRYGKDRRLPVNLQAFFQGTAAGILAFLVAGFAVNDSGAAIPPVAPINTSGKRNASSPPSIANRSAASASTLSVSASIPPTACFRPAMLSVAASASSASAPRPRPVRYGML